MVRRRIVLIVFLCAGCEKPVTISPSSEAAVHEVISARLDLAALLDRLIDDDSIAQSRQKLEQAFADLDEAESHLAAIVNSERFAVQKKFRNELNAALDVLTEQQVRVSGDPRIATITRQAANASKNRRRSKRGGPAASTRQATEGRAAAKPMTDD